MMKKALSSITFTFLLFLTIKFFNANSWAANQDFIFVGEIPTFCKFQKIELDEVIKAERAYLEAKSKVISVEEIFNDVEYVIDTREKEKWRGKLTIYEKRAEDKPAYDSRLDVLSSCPIFNSEVDKNTILDLVQLFKDESFGVSPEESKKDFFEKMRIVLLANRMKSVFAIKNRSLKHVNTLSNENSLILAGSWEPKWRKRTAHGAFNDATLKEVRQYLRKCSLKMQEAQTEEDKNIWLKKIKKISDQEEGVCGHVPYHELREVLRTNERRRQFVSSFVSKNPAARLYEATHDSDVVGLRLVSDNSIVKSELETTAIGLYSHYLEILRRKPSEIPDVLTTGYRAIYDSGFVREGRKEMSQS